MLTLPIGCDPYSKLSRRSLIDGEYLRSSQRTRGPANDSTRLTAFSLGDFFDYNRLQQSARCVLSDSGTISEESVILGFPAVTIRDSIERPEAMDAGSIIITGLNTETISTAVNMVCQQWDAGLRGVSPADYEIHNCSQRVVNLIVGTTLLSRSWSHLHERRRP